MAEKWTKADEEAFASMALRRDRVLGARRSALREALTPAIGRFVEVSDALLDAVIERADEVRDALAPYDSGVRAAPKAEKAFAPAFPSEPLAVAIRPRNWGEGYWITGPDGKAASDDVFSTVDEAMARCKANGWAFIWDEALPLQERSD